MREGSDAIANNRKKIGGGNNLGYVLKNIEASLPPPSWEVLMIGVIGGFGLAHMITHFEECRLGINNSFY